jgi:DNA-binding LacI/PurR family transcriptional regulator
VYPKGTDARQASWVIQLHFWLNCYIYQAMAPRDTPRLLQARSFLLHCAAERLAAGSDAMPTMRELAAAAGASHRTMWKALQGLVADGLLATRQGGEIRVVGAAGARASDGLPRGATQAASGPKWQRLRQQVERDIMSGAYSVTSHLPSHKELASRYGAAYRTVRKALLALAEDGLVAADGPRFRLRNRFRSARETVALLAKSWDSGEPILATPRSADQLRAVNSECSRAGLTLKLLTCWFTGGELRLTDESAQWLRRNGGDGLLGCIMETMSLGTDSLISLARRLCSAGRPLALLDETGQRDLRHQAWPPTVRIFSVANSPTPGVDVGRYLLGLGHRRVAYLSPVHDRPWSVMRAVGLRRALAAAGCPDGVLEYTSMTGALADNAYETADVRALLQRLRLPARDAGTAPGRDMLAALRASGPETVEAMLRQARSRLATPIFEAALRQADASAWVLASDYMAEGCLAFLSAHGRRVPQDVSVVGFDDSPDAFRLDLTSYSFDPQAVAQALLRHILNPVAAGSRRGREVVEVKGFVNARRTTAMRAGSQ